MRISLSAVLAALLVIGAASRAEACDFPKPPTFKESLGEAQNVFVFRLDGARYKRETLGPSLYSTWVEGIITPVQNLYGNPSRFRRIKFTTMWCGAVNLVVGHHYLIATNASGDTIELVSSDASLYDIEGFYSPMEKKRSLRSIFVLPVIQAIYGGKPLPDNFPPRDIAERTVLQPPPPPPKAR